MGESLSMCGRDQNLVKILRTPAVKKPFRVPRWKWEDNIKVSFKEQGSRVLAEISRSWFPDAMCYNTRVR
jgi:hypothetical protein